MDNLNTHHSKEVREVITTKQLTTLFIPPYSPRCNPIEKVFGMMKPEYRSNCPQIHFQVKEAFKKVFENVLAKYQDAPFNIDRDPDFTFNGYDTKSLIRTCVHHQTNG